MPKASRPRKKASVNLARGKAKNNTVLDFNPDQRIDFITGFRKRKNERRKVAEKSLKEKEREDRIIQRKEIREELQRVREEKRRFKSSLQSHSQDNRIYFAGETKDVNEVLRSASLTAADSPTVVDTGCADYQVNNQLVTVVTKQIDFSNDMEEESVFAPLREESSDDENDADTIMKEDNRDTISLYQWNEEHKEWQTVSAPVKPSKLQSETTIRGLSLNVWYSDKWQKARTKALLNLLHQHQADFVCLQEVGSFLLSEIEKDHWIREFYCVSDIFGDSMKEGEFGVTILASRALIQKSFIGISLLSFSNSISNRSAMFLHIRGVTIVNIHLEGLNNERIRMEQMKQLLEYLENEKNVFMAGDFGALHGEWKRHTELLETHDYGDVWLDLSMDEEGWTFDQEEISEMINAKQRKKKNKTKSKFDRILVKSEECEWRGINIELIAKDPVVQCQGRILISTHFGLLATLTNRMCSFVALSCSADE